MPLPAQGSAYSINRGLWGITIGGQETLTSESSIPESAWVLSANAFYQPKEPTKHTLEFRATACRSRSMASAVAGCADRSTGDTRGQLRHWPRHSSRRHRARHQRAGRVRSARGHHPDHGASRAGETRAQCTAGTYQGQHCRRLRRPRARGQTARPCVRRHRSTADVIAESASREGHFALRPGQLFIDGVESPTHCSPQPRVCTAKRPANGRRPTHSATRAYSLCPVHCRPGLPGTDHEKRRRRQNCIRRTAQ